MKYQQFISFLFIAIGLILISVTIREALPSQTTIASPQGSDIIEKKPTPTIQLEQTISAWIDSSYEREALRSLGASSTNVSVILPLWYSINQDGNLDEDVTVNLELLQSAKESQVGIMPSFTSSDPKGTVELLTNKDKQQTILDTLIEEATIHTYTGYDIFIDTLTPEHGEDFIAFLSTLQKEFLTHNLTLSVTVPARTGKPTDDLVSRAYDWKTIQTIVDIFRIKTFTLSRPKSNPTPIIPADWYSDVLTYAAATVVKPKLVIGLPVFGYQWNKGIYTPKTITQLLELLDKKSLTPTRDPRSGEIQIGYEEKNDPTVLLYPDRQTLLFYIEQAKRKNITQFTFWSLGMEDETMWESL